MIAQHTQILDDLQKTLTISGYKVTGRSPRALQLRVKCNEHGSGKTHRIDVDILPAANLERCMFRTIIRGKKCTKEDLLHKLLFLFYDNNTNQHKTANQLYLSYYPVCLTHVTRILLYNNFLERYS